MPRESERLRLSSRYIHTGNSGVTLSIHRDVEKVDRAELVVENGAFGAFNTTLEIRGNDSDEMTSHQIRDLALMFLDAADLLENDCNIYREEGHPPLSGFESHRGTPSIADYMGIRNGRNPGKMPSSIERYFPGRYDGMPLDPEKNLKAFFDIVEERDSESDTGTFKGKKGRKRTTQEQAALSAEYAKAEEEGRRKREILQAGFRYLAAKRIFDLASAHLKKAIKAYHDVCGKELAR